MSDHLSIQSFNFIVPKNGSLIPREIRSKLLIGRLDEETKTPGTLVLPGVIQDGRIPRRIAELAPGTDVASAFPFWDVPPTEASLQALTLAYPKAIIDAWREAYGDQELVPNVVAESLAALGVAQGEAENPEDYDTIVYLRPHGLNSEHFGGDQNERLREFGVRAIQTFMQQDQSPRTDRWNLYAGMRATRRLGRHTLKQVGIGLGEDCRSILEERIPARRLAGKRTALLMGEEDRIHPLAELEESAHRIGSSLDTMVLPSASHRSMATRRGAQDLHIALSYVTRVHR